MVEEIKIPEGYKQTEVGVIPDDWVVKSLNNITYLIIDNRGKTPPLSEHGTIELIESASISFVTRLPNYSKVTKHVSNKTYKSWFRDHPKPNDILISTVGEYSGSTAFYLENRGTIAQNIIALRIQKENPNYVFCWTRASSFVSQLKQVMMNQAQPSLRVPWLMNFKIPLPPTRTEQTAIATALSDMDSLIEGLEKLLVKKRNIKQGAMQELLKPKEGWVEQELGDMLLYEQPTKYLVSSTEYNPNSGVPVLTAGKSFVLGYTNETFGVFENSPVIIFDDFTTSSQYVDFKFKVKSSALKILKTRAKGFDIVFLFALMQLIKFDATDHKRYWISEYQKIVVKVPESEEQTRIANILSEMDTEITQLETQLSKYKMLKTGMMQELLTGKKRLV